jgi:hypothetical protein
MTDLEKRPENEVHSSDCAYWCDESCDCMFRYDADDLLDRQKDKERL